MLKNNLVFTAILLLITGCASSVTQDIVVDSEADPKVDFGGYKAYTWLGSAAIVYDPEGKWEPPQFDADAEIRFLINRELRARGMSEDSANPDMVVAYAAGIDMDSMDINFDPQSELVKFENVPIGSLTVILIDANSQLAIWGGSATAEIQQDATPEVQKKRLDFAIKKMFKGLK